MLEVSLLILGLCGLIAGTELVVKGALAIADRFKISKIFLGLTILAIGTDLPELTISITSSIDKLNGTDTSGLIIGNVIGSNFGQVILTLGLVGFFSYFTLTKKEILREGGMLLGSLVLVALLGSDGQITQIEGLILIATYIAYFVTIPRSEATTNPTLKSPKAFNPYLVALFIIGGLAAITVSSTVVVDNGLEIAKFWGLEQTFIGIMMIGVGTSLPEVALSVRAAMKGAKGLSIGNIIGSNIFDTLFVLGTGASISGLNISSRILKFDLPFLFVSSAIVVAFFINKKGLQRREALILLTIYTIYVGFKFLGY